MATTFSFKLRFLEPAPPLKLRTPILYKKAITLAIPVTTQKFNRDVQNKMSESMASYENCKQSQTQELVDLLQDCAESRSVRVSEAVHAYLLKCNVPDENLVVVLNHLAYAYSKCSDFSAAQLVFNKMSQRNAFSWTVMILASTENGLLCDGIKYFCEMLEYGIFPDGFTYSAIIQLCIVLKSIDWGKAVHAQIVISGFASHIVVSTSLLNMYAKLGEIEDSCRVFSNMEEHNEISWAALISGFTANSLYLEAYSHFLTMKEEGITPNIYTLISVLKAVGMLGDTGKGKQVHKFVSELNLESNVCVGTALIDMYSKCGALYDARSVFDINFMNTRLNMPWNAMISGYSQCRCSLEALEIFIKMCENDIRSDIYTYCSIFNAIADLRCLQFGREVHGVVLKSGCHLKTLSIDNAIADAYSKCGSIEDVRKVLDRIEDRDIVSWTTLVGAYCQCFEWQEALAIFSQMREEGFAPNQFTFSSVLVACASLCILEYGRQVHALLHKAGLSTDKCVNSALIDMYGKCGSISNAGKAFESISNPDVVSWTSIIWGHAQHGYAAYALQLFRRMEQMGIEANSVTLLCVLFACSHGGMVDEGLHYFQSMEGTYGLVPEMEHYACIVDLLGRVGRLNDALEFIREMPVEPTEMVWQTLLGACRIHGSVELGEIAAKKLLSTQPECSATYVLLSNTYMEIGSSLDGLVMRNMMKERGVKKEPGYSWISVKCKVHKFYARDQQHPQKDDTYVRLEELRKHIKTMGYVPDLRFALQGED